MAFCFRAPVLFAILTLSVSAVAAPPAPTPPTPTQSVPTLAALAYAPAAPAGSKGHLLDLYLPAGHHGPVPVVIWTGGSAWTADTGKDSAGWIAPDLLRAGYAVAGVSVRSASQTRFPGQLHDIKAAIRWLRTHAAQYGLDGDHIGIIGDSSGGWTSMMAALTAGQMAGPTGETGVSDAVQAAIAFYPPTDFTAMDRWTIRRCVPHDPVDGCHDDADSPESQLIGCPIQSCPARVAKADPIRYISGKSPPILIFHGESDNSVPHEQGEALYMALNHACRDAVFISLPMADHGPAHLFLSDDKIRTGATIRSTTAQGCRVQLPRPYTPDMHTITGFLDRYLKPHRG